MNKDQIVGSLRQSATAIAATTLFAPLLAKVGLTPNDAVEIAGGVGLLVCAGWQLFHHQGTGANATIADAVAASPPATRQSVIAGSTAVADALASKK